MMKRLLILFGILDIVTILRSSKQIIAALKNLNDFPLLNLTLIISYSLFILSGYLLIRQHKGGIWLTYIQFPLRLSFLILSFGFLFSINSLIGGLIPYTILIWIAGGLEIIRLIIKILIHRKFYSRTREAFV